MKFSLNGISQYTHITCGGGTTSQQRCVEMTKPHCESPTYISSGREVCLKRIILLILGWLTLIIGGIGIIIPVLPTTPFLIISAFCFSGSSERLYNMLLENKYFGSYISNYRNNTGVPAKAKKRAIIFLWIGLIISILITRKPLVAIILAIIGSCVTIHIRSLKEK